MDKYNNTRLPYMMQSIHGLKNSELAMNSYSSDDDQLRICSRNGITFRAKKMRLLLNVKQKQCVTS